MTTMHESALKRAKGAILGCRVVSTWHNVEGVVVQYDPSGGMCDALVERDDGSRGWISLSDCNSANGGAPLPVRREVRAEMHADKMTILQVILEQFLEEDVVGGRRWPGCEYGKIHVGASLITAIRDGGGTPMFRGTEVVMKASGRRQK